MAQEKYLHGYDSIEQKRLETQAAWLEQSLFEHVDFRGRKKLLEVGCGVGAQTRILLRRFPELHVTGIDISEAQIAQARAANAGLISEGRATFLSDNAEATKLNSNTFDSAYLCWVLEHVANPLTVLREVRRLLQPGASIVISEVQNSTLFLEPRSDAVDAYWAALNDFQIESGGDPYVGVKLGTHLADAGFTNVQSRVRPRAFDKTQNEERRGMIEYWTELLLSASPQLLSADRVSKDLVDHMHKDMIALHNNPNGVFFYCYIQATATAP